MYDGMYKQADPQCVTISQFKELLSRSMNHFNETESVVVGGRIQSIEKTGLVLGSARDFIQIKCEAMSPSISMPRVGDIVQIRLQVKSWILNENSVFTEVLAIEKLVESRSAQLVKPSPEKLFLYKEWNEFLNSIEQFFVSKSYQKIRTPSLVTCPGLEPFLDSMSVNYSYENLAHKKYLPTSPELHLKKALAFGFEKVFEVRSCFRSAEMGSHHQPEFQMLEWYQSFASLEQLKSELTNLLTHLNLSLTNREPPIQSENIFKVYTMSQLFKEFLNFNLTPQTSKDEMIELANSLSMRDISEQDDWDDVFFRIFITSIEPNLDTESLTIIEKYPPSQAALARLDENGWADRFELYWKGFEIANAFSELNDPDEQQARFLADQKKRESLGKDVPLIDEEFIEALKWGMPPSSGIALGTERLFMAFYGLNQIQQFQLFPYESQSP
jgi:lysyl-tRNA synthetase class 2